MEAQLQRPSHGHHQYYEGDPQDAGFHSVIEGEGEAEHDHHGEKKSVLKKVKDKAKKIKDKIKKHDHKQEGGYQEEDDDDDVEEMGNDPEVHDAPMIESTVIRSTNLPRETDVNLEKPTDTREDGYDQNVKVERQFAPGQMTPESGSPPATEACAPENKNPNVEEPKVKVGPDPEGLEEDPHSPKNRPPEVHPSNYQSKVIDPTGAGGKEAEVAPLVGKFDNLNVDDQPPESGQESYTGSHDNRINQEPNPVSSPENPPELNPKSLDPAKPQETSWGTVAGKISSATSNIANKAVSAVNFVAPKMGYGGGRQEGHDPSNKPASESAAEYAQKVAPVYEKVAGAGSAAMSKVQGGGGAEHGDGDTEAVKRADKGVSMREYLAEKFRPGDEDKALSEVITDAFHKKKERMLRSTGEEQPVGKVTESEEVAARLGTGAENKREGEDARAAGAESSGQGMVDRLKDAVGLWLGKSTGKQTAQDSIGRSYVSDVGSAPSGVVQGKETAEESGN